MNSIRFQFAFQMDGGVLQICVMNELNYMRNTHTEGSMPALLGLSLVG